MVFYTPDDVWGPAMFESHEGEGGPTIETLRNDMRNVRETCVDSLQRHRIHLASFADCVLTHFPAYDNTPLRGLAVVADIPRGPTHHARPGYSLPAGYTFFDAFQLQPIPGFRPHLRDVWLRIFANSPVVVLRGGLAVGLP